MTPTRRHDNAIESYDERDQQIEAGKRLDKWRMLINERATESEIVEAWREYHEFTIEAEARS